VATLAGNSAIVMDEVALCPFLSVTSEVVASTNVIKPVLTPVITTEPSAPYPVLSKVVLAKPPMVVVALYSFDTLTLPTLVVVL